MSEQPTAGKQLVIVGAGYAALALARTLGKQQGLSITMLTNKSYLEYYPTLYRVAVGYTSNQTCVPLTDILAGTNVEMKNEQVTGVNFQDKKVMTQSGTEYGYDYVLIAVGSETNYFGIPGMAEQSYSFKSAIDALKLRARFTEMVELAASNPAEAETALRFAVVGSGPTGTELSSELVEYVQGIAREKKVDPALVKVEMIEAVARVLPTMSEPASAKVATRLANRGVMVHLNTAVATLQGEDLQFKEGGLKAKTVIWTAGVKTNALIGTLGLELDKRGRVVVDEYLQAKGFPGVFVAGDAASTQYAGTAQTAQSDGFYVAKAIAEDLRSAATRTPYVAHQPIYAIPVGPHWGVVQWGTKNYYGYTGYVLRRLADLRYFMSILPFGKALSLWGKHNHKGEEFSMLPTKAE